MAWEVNILKKDYHPGRNKMEVVVNFSNGSVVVKETFMVNSIDDLKNQARSKIIQLNTLISDYTSLPTGSVDVSKIISPPTQDEIDRRNYITDLNNYQGILNAQSLNVLGSPLNMAGSILTALQNNFKVSYIDIF